MGFREYRDGLREQWVANSAVCPNRSISYIPSSTQVALPLEALVSAVDFNKDLPDDKKVNATVFSGLKLTIEPTRTDIIIYNDKTFTVREWKLVGTLYSVMAENAKRNKVTSRKFQ